MQPTILEATFSKARIIAVAIMASIFIYIGLAELILFDQMHVSFPNLDLFRIVLYIISGVEIGIILWFRNFLLRKTNALPPARTDRVNQQSGSVNDPPHKQEAAFCQRLISITIISFALSESIAIYGLVLFILAKQRQDLYLLAGLALILMLIFFPRFDDWKYRLDEFKKDTQNQQPIIQ